MDEVNKQYFLQILAKYRLGTATQEEIQFLEAYYNLFELNEDVITDENEAEYLYLKESIKSKLDQQIAFTQQKSSYTRLRAIWFKYAAAAILLLMVSAGGYLMLSNNAAKKNTIANAYKGIVPGGNKAWLTLANGTKISLDDAGKGQIAQQAGVTVTKTGDGQIVYQTASNTNSQDAPLQNTISTPKGGQYRVILPDGTNVWLNAASSLTYPTAFNGTERMVSLTGEAYFEVTKNKLMPFKVKTDKQTVEVLGTHFNINAYTDEAAVKTTLLEGSVKVSTATTGLLIVPGEQAAVTGAGSISKYTVNTDNEIAWKNGIFSFEDEDIRSIMRQVSRWYDIDVIYDGNLPQEKFIGEISRSSSLADVFKILELNNVQFDIDGKTVKVSYKK